MKGQVRLPMALAEICNSYDLIQRMTKILQPYDDVKMFIVLVQINLFIIFVQRF